MARHYASSRRYRSYTRYRRARWTSPGRTSPKEIAIVAVIGAGLALHFGHDITHASAASAKPPVQDAATASQPSPAAAKAIAYARAQLGKPYLWGGTGPAGYDCSGLVMEAWASAGVQIERTSEDQWASLPHIPASQLRPGDLVYYAGSDGTQSDPGHVVMYIGGGWVIQAFGTGYPVMRTPLAAVDAGPLTGYARP
jgi:cell wall-associated NlpC family hydrolase